ncbi:MAG TPA: GrpB family protein [Streptosporangiaceae bacterium]|nr:GrpB family protein [Streptosporangiaceae bacterium]
MQLVEYNEAWPATYLREKERLTKVLGRSAHIEHIGSTSVPGLMAKPIIDILVGLPAAEISQAVSALLPLGYMSYGTAGVEGRDFLRDRESSRHLHVTVFQSQFWRDRLAFRDHLRRNAEDRDLYAELKRRLSAEFACQRPLYTSGKADFIARCIERFQTTGEERYPPTLSQAGDDR